MKFHCTSSGSLEEVPQTNGPIRKFNDEHKLKGIGHFPAKT